MADVDENTRARQEGRTGGVTLSDYVDYRTYLDYDIKVTNRVTGQQAYLSRVSRDSSGGENQAPFYVAICASLLQIYEKSENSIRLVLLDEAFSKMTSDRIRPMMSCSAACSCRCCSSPPWKRVPPSSPTATSPTPSSATATLTQ